jgi:SGNH domain (fused to AT3 domains)
VLSQYPGVDTFDPSNVLCKDGVCNAVIENHVMYTDSSHLSESGSYIQGSKLERQFPLKR